MPNIFPRYENKNNYIWTRSPIPENIVKIKLEVILENTNIKCVSARGYVLLLPI